MVLWGLSFRQFDRRGTRDEKKLRRAEAEKVIRKEGLFRVLGPPF